MARTDEWGVGNKASAPAFATTTVEGRPVELIMGEHPHSRRDNNEYARFPDGTIESFSGHRTLIGFHIESRNYLKESALSGNDVRKGGSGTITFDGIQVFAFSFRDPFDALHEAETKAKALLEFHTPYWTEKGRAQIIGQHVYYRDEPAIVTRLNVEDAEIFLVPDIRHIKGFRVPPRVLEEDDLEYEKQIWLEDYGHGLRVSILSPDVYWWRKK